MNRIKNILWGICLAIPMFLLFSGCKKFLDRKPLTATLEDLNQGGLEGQIYGLYGAIRNGDVAGQGFGGIPWLAVQNFRSDDSEKGSDPQDGADWGVIYDNFQYVKDHWSSNTYWDHHYTLINMANTALQTADSLELDEPEDLVNQAEARFFRAFSYFDLVRTFGEVPLITFRIYNPDDAKRAKATIPEIYAQIDEDLNFAAQHLPLNWNNPAGQSRFPGRLTRGAAQALHAKTYMFPRNFQHTPDQNWGQALSLAEEVINSGQYALVQEFQQIWTEAGENSSESIFEIQAYVGPGQTDNYYSWYAIAQGIRGAGDWDLGWGWNTPTQNLVDAWNAYDPQDKDEREDATILFSGQPDDFPGSGKTLPEFPTIPRRYWNKKVYPEPAMQARTGSRQGGWINQRVIRFADVLLLAAEAANESGNQSLALEYLNQVRNRAGLEDITGGTQAAIRTAIQNERRFELAMEGERFFDLVRWRLAQTVLGPQGYQNRHRFLPLPQPAIDFSGGLLIQNPEW